MHSADKLKKLPMTDSFLEKEATESANVKLDAMLGKIRERLAEIKKSKRPDHDQPQFTSRSSPKSQPISPTTSVLAINQSGSSNFMDDFDELKQI